MFCAARRAVRNAKQKKTVPAKNSEANFWRPLFTWPLLAGKRANANFACSEGGSAPGAPRYVPGWPFLRGLPLLCGLLRPVPVCLPCVLCAHFSLIFCLFLFGFCLSTFFSFVAHAATGTPFSFRKENGGKEPRGGAIAPPSNPHSCALRPITPSSALLAGLTALRAANRRLTGKRLKSQGAELSFSSVSVRRGTSAPFRRSPPFSRCWPA